MEWKFTYEALNELGELYVAELTKQLIAADKDATGNLIKSLDYEVLKKLDGFLLEIQAAGYLKYVDQGRKPNSKMPPVDSIIPWVKARGLQFRNKKGQFITRESTAFVISRSIGRKGIKPTNVIEKTQISVLNKYDDIIRSAFKKDIEDILNNIMQKIRLDK